MKIVFLSHVDMNLYLFRLPIMQALVHKGHNVIALCPRGEYFDKFKMHGIEAIHYDIQRSSLNPLKEIMTIRHIAQKLKDIKPDIIQTFTLKPNIYGAFAAKLARIPCIISSVTGLGSFYIQSGMKITILRCVIENLNKIAFYYAKAVVFQNNDDMQLYINKNIIKSSKAILIKGSGIDTQKFERKQIPNTTIAQYKEQLGIRNEDIVVLMIARAIVHKGVYEYYKAAEHICHQHDNIRFLFVGDVDEGNIAPIPKEFLHSNMHVQWLGKRDDVRELLALADIFVLPSYREGIPRTLLEAGSMELPIVTTHAIGCKDVVSDGVNGFLVPVKDERKLAECITTLAHDTPLRKQQGMQSRKKIIEEFSVESIVSQHLELYKKFLGDLS